MAAVNLYDQPCFKTNEIDDVWPNRLLSPEFQPVQPFVPEVGPQDSLRVGLLHTESPSPLGLNRDLLHGLRPPPSNSLPPGEGG